MRLDWAILANYAELQNGLAYISGGGVNRFWTAMYPGVFAGCLVLRFEIHPSEFGTMDRPVTFPVEVRIVDEDGTMLGNLNASTGLQVESGKPREPGHAVLIIPMAVTIPKIADYRIDVLIAGAHAKSLMLHAIYPPAALPSPTPPPPQQPPESTE